MKKEGGYITKKVLIAGQPGTKKYIEAFGDALICVRYRYSEELKKRQTTVEIVVETNQWKKDRKRIAHNRIMGIRVSYHEKEIRKIIQSVGARWDPVKRLWKLPYQRYFS